MNRFFVSLVLALLLLLAVPFTEAQDATGKVTGSVTDSSGAIMPGAHVTVTNTATNISHSTVTDSSGVYQVLQLPIGLYKVVVDAPGFEQTTVQSKTALQINETLRIDVQLQVGKVSGEITVESNVSQVETENQTVGGTVNGQAIFELPLNGRDTLDLLKTLPGVSASNPDSSAAGNYSIGGMRTDSVTYLLDGGTNNDLLSNGVVADPNPDAIAEFRVLESNYSAEYGRNAGGIVSVVTKSGTNKLHGTLYDYVRNNYFDANSFFNNEQGLGVPILKRNQFGGTVGGPILRDKLFFFFSYEGQRQSQLIAEGKVATFTPAEAAGDFSNSQGQAQVAAFLANNPYYQPDPTLAAEGIISPSRIDPVAAAYFAHGLIPTSPSGYLFPEASATTNFDEYLGKIDYNITSRDSLSGTFTTTNSPSTSPFAFANVTGYTSINASTNWFGSVTYNHTFTPALLNELRITAQREVESQDTPASSNSPIATALGANLPSDQPTGPPELWFEGSGLDIGYSYQGPTKLVDNTYVFSDNLSWTKGNHNLKFGFYFSPFQNNTVYDYFIDGGYFFYGPGTSVGSGYDFADFLLGAPDEYTQSPKAPSDIRSDQYAGYVQDSWKVAKRVTLDFGLRYEYAEPKYDTQGRTFSFIPGLQSTRFPDAPTGLVFPGDPGAPKGSNFPDRTNFAPRFGYAWDVFGTGKTSIRGGFGMFYDILKGEDNLQFNGQPPFFAYADVYPALTNSPSALQDPFAASGSVDPFPSKPPTSNLNFAQAGYLPFGGSSIYLVDPNLKTPYVFQYNTTIQQQLPSSMVLEIGYVGYSAHGLTSLVDVNPFPIGGTTRLYDIPAENAGISPLPYANLYEFQNISRANYNSLETSLTRRVASSKLGSAFFTVGYTLGHEIDNVSGFRQRNSVVPAYDHELFRASGDTDVRDTFTLSGGWDLPFDRMWERGPKLLTRGWSLYPIFNYRTGFPIDVFSGLQTSPDDPGPSGAGDAGLVHADVVGSLATLNPSTYQTLANPNSGGSSGGNYWFNPASLSNARAVALDNSGLIATSYPYGTLPRNSLRGPGQTNLDLSVSKHFIIREGTDLELRGDAFNVLNHTEFENPNTTIGSPEFGQISTTYAARILQLALHLRF